MPTLVVGMLEMFHGLGFGNASESEMLSAIQRKEQRPGHAHSVTFSCFQRRPFLSKERTREWTLDTINQALREAWLSFVGLRGHAGACASAALADSGGVFDQPNSFVSEVTRFQARAAVRARTSYRTFLRHMEDRQPNGTVHYRFWQRGGGYDRNVTEPATIWAEIDYIHANPVRRGLCQRATDRIWSSA